MRVAFLFPLFLYSTLVHAQQGDTLRHYALDDSVVIVAGRYANILARETNSLAVVDGSEITRLSDHSLLEALQWEVPSAFLTDTRVGGFGVGPAGTGMLSLRGMGGKPNTGVAVMIDGHPDFMGIFGHPLPDVYGKQNVERVDVLLGPASTVFGGHALGGVVNIVTRAVHGNAVNVSVESGSWNSWNASASIMRSFGQHGLRFSLRHGRSDGHIARSDFRSTHAQVDWDWRLSPVWKISLRSRYTPSRFDDPSRSDDPVGLGTYADIRRGMGQLIAENSGANLRGSTQAFFNAGHHEFYDGFVSNDRVLGLSTYQQYMAGGGFSIASGAELLRYGGTATLGNEEHIMSTGGVYGVAMYSPLRFLHLRAGLRYQLHSLNLSILAPHLGISLTPLSGLRIYASLQSGFRHPTLRELYLFPTSNPDLAEERSLGFEVGSEYVFPRGSARLALYETRADNMITPVPLPQPPPSVRFRNAFDETLRGAEVQLRFRLTDFLHAQLAWSTLNAGRLTAFNPSAQFKYVLRALAGPVALTFTGQYVQGLHAGNNSTLPMPDYHLLDLTAEWNTGLVEVYVKGKNILDRTYAILPGYLAPGTHVFAGVRYAVDN